MNKKRVEGNSTLEFFRLQWLNLLLFLIVILIALFVYKQFNDKDQITSEELHFDHLPITYYLANEYECGPLEAGRIRRAFGMIQNQTENIVSFIENYSTGDIVVFCSSEFPTYADQWTAGLTEPVYIGEEIAQAKITFFNTLPNSNRISSTCYSFPDTEIHEILHSLGFEHRYEEENINHIMHYRSKFCREEIDRDVIQKLKEIYS